MTLHYLELTGWLTGDDLLAFTLDELYQSSGGHRGLKRSDIWKETVLKAAAERRATDGDQKASNTKAKSKSQAKA